MAYLDKFTKSKKFDTQEEKIHLIPLEKIQVSEQVRKHFNEEKIQELANSIKERGLQSPIRVTPFGKDKYVILTGERRFRAHQNLGEKNIKAIIITDKQKQDEIVVDQLVENIQRENLNHIETAKGFLQLKTMGKSQREIAKYVGLEETKISKHFALMKKIPEDYLVKIEECCQKADIPFDTLYKIAQAKSKQKMKTLIEKLLEEVNNQAEELEDIPEDEKQTTTRGGVEYDVDEVWEAIKWVKKKDMSKFVSKLTPRQIDWFLEVHRKREF